MDDLNDAELVQRCRDGEDTAFAVLIARHELHLRRLLYSVVRFRPDVEDILQESLLQAYLGINSLRDAERFRSWLFGIGLNLARLHLRLISRQSVIDRTITPAQSNGAASRPPEQSVQQAEREARLRLALADLPQAEREALLLVYIEGLSHRDAAESLGASPGAIKVRVHRGRRRLASALSDEFDARPKVAIPKTEEANMIPVTVYDVLMSESLIDHRAILSPLLNALSPTTREQLLDDLVIRVDSRRWPAWKLFHAPAASEALPDEERSTLEELGRQLLPHHVVLLKDNNDSRALPIWIGPAESAAIVARLQSTPFMRPILPDLLASLLTLGDLHVERAAVSRLHEQIFYGTLWVRMSDRVIEVDCRPSDAIALAIRLDTPLFVAEEVMTEAGVAPNDDGSYPIGRNPDEQMPVYSLIYER
jgi:RNA polymerase sigma factor (sigma-70 family)